LRSHPAHSSAFLIQRSATGTYAEVPTDGSVPNAPQKTPLESMLDIIRSLFPPNLFKAAVDMNVLGIITFSIGTALALSVGRHVH
jgi:Na+/H+-dicarboxylate symporter